MTNVPVPLAASRSTTAKAASQVSEEPLDVLAVAAMCGLPTGAAESEGWPTARALSEGLPAVDADADADADDGELTRSGSCVSKAQRL